MYSRCGSLKSSHFREAHPCHSPHSVSLPSFVVPVVKGQYIWMATLLWRNPNYLYRGAGSNEATFEGQIRSSGNDGHYSTSGPPNGLDVTPRYGVTSTGFVWIPNRWSEPWNGVIFQFQHSTMFCPRSLKHESTVWLMCAMGSGIVNWMRNPKTSPPLAHPLGDTGVPECLLAYPAPEIFQIKLQAAIEGFHGVFPIADDILIDSGGRHNGWIYIYSSKLFYLICLHAERLAIYSTVSLQSSSNRCKTSLELYDRSFTDICWWRFETAWLIVWWLWNDDFLAMIFSVRRLWGDHKPKDSTTSGSTLLPVCYKCVMTGAVFHFSNFCSRSCMTSCTN